MKNRTGVLLLLLAAMAVSPLMAAHSGNSGVEPLGRLEPFWRYSAALGPYLESGYPLVEIPGYLLRGDFPYRKRPYPREVPFADHLSVVRLLGGYNDKEEGDEAGTVASSRDLAYRGGDGKVQYRMELLQPRLQPYLDQGYTELTLVLDNVPWCFPEKPFVGASYGQSAPPRDPGEWYDFIRVLCMELVRIMGAEAADKLRFRVGTENNARERFTGTYEEYERHYDATAAAVKDVLPGAKVGPFNISGASVRGIDRGHNVNAFTLAEHCFTGKNSLTRSPGIPFDWVAFSRYYKPGNDPAASAQGCREIWEEFERRVRKLKGVSREIHEFGIAPFGEVEKGQFVSDEPGALGAAQTAQMMFRLRQAGIQRLWHWGVMDRFRDRKNQMQELFTGQAWLMLVLDHAVGGDACLLEPTTPSAAGAQYVGLASVTTDGGIFILSAYHTDIAVHTPETVRFTVPKGCPDLGRQQLRYAVLNRETAVHDRIRRDLEQEALLNEEFIAHPDRLGGVREMGRGRAAEQLVGDRMAEYLRVWEESLVLRPFTEAQGNVTSMLGHQEINVRLAAPEVLVLVVGEGIRGVP